MNNEEKMMVSDVLPIMKLVSSNDTSTRWSRDCLNFITDVPFEGETELEIVKLLKDDEPAIDGEDMFKRAAKLGSCAGLQHAECLLAQQEFIPKEWRPHWLIFAGTKFSFRPNRWARFYGMHVPSILLCRDNKWYPTCYQLSTVNITDPRIVRIKDNK
jgi:hypothetical protein